MSIDPKVFKQVRKALGLTQEELADAIGLSRVTINKMERGRLARGIPDEIAERLLSLQKRPLLADTKPPARTKADVKAALDKAMERVADEDDLWDNEEEDES